MAPRSGRWPTAERHSPQGLARGASLRGQAPHLALPSWHPLSGMALTARGGSRWGPSASDTMSESERTWCHRSGQRVRALKRPGPRHRTHGLSPPALIAGHRRVTAPSLDSALLACGQCIGDVSRSCSIGMGFAETTNNRVTERHGTASVAVEDKLAVLPPKTREEHMPWHQDTRRETMAEHNAVVGIYTTHTEAEAAVKALQQAGFNMQKLSIVGKDAHTEAHVVGYYNAGDRMQFWGTLGTFWGWLGGLLVGGGPLCYPRSWSRHRARPAGGRARWGAGRGCGGGRAECAGRRVVQYWHPHG